VLQEPRKGAGSENDGTMLVTGAEALQQYLGEHGDIFAALAQRWNGKTYGGKPEGKVRHEQALAGHLAQGRLRGGQHHGAARRTVLQSLENAQKQPLAGRGEKIDTIEISEARQCGRVGVANQPLACVAALEAGAGQRRAAEDKAGQGVLTDARFALNGGHLKMRRSHLRLHQ